MFDTCHVCYWGSRVGTNSATTHNLQDVPIKGKTCPNEEVVALVKHFRFTIKSTNRVIRKRLRLYGESWEFYQIPFKLTGNDIPVTISFL